MRNYQGTTRGVADLGSDSLQNEAASDVRQMRREHIKRGMVLLLFNIKATRVLLFFE